MDTVKLWMYEYICMNRSNKILYWLVICLVSFKILKYLQEEKVELKKNIDDIDWFPSARDGGEK